MNLSKDVMEDVVNDNFTIMVGNLSWKITHKFVEYVECNFLIAIKYRATLGCQYWL